MDILQYQFDKHSNIHNVDLKLHYCGTERCAPGHEVGPMVRDCYKIHYIHSGKGLFRTEGETYTLGKGQGFLISPEKLAYYKADEEDPWVYSWVAFDGMQMEHYLSRSHLLGSHPVFTTAQDAYIQSCFLEMFKATERPMTNELRLLGALYSFLSVILDETAVPESAPNATEPYVRQAVDMIRGSYASDLKIGDLADRLTISRKYLAKIFKEATGLSPQQYLLQYRMNRAGELIRNTSLSMGEIACSVGYKDPFLFSRMYKKVTGASPREHRKT